MPANLCTPGKMKEIVVNGVGSSSSSWELGAKSKTFVKSRLIDSSGFSMAVILMAMRAMDELKSEITLKKRDVISSATITAT